MYQKTSLSHPKSKAPASLHFPTRDIPPQITERIWDRETLAGLKSPQYAMELCHGMSKWDQTITNSPTCKSISIIAICSINQAY